MYALSIPYVLRSSRNRENVWGWTSGVQRTAQGKDFELILMVKWRLDIL